MDSHQAKRANAISFQLWLDKNYKSKNATNPTGSCRVCRLQQPCAEHLSGEGAEYPLQVWDRVHYLRELARFSCLQRRC